MVPSTFDMVVTPTSLTPVHQPLEVVEDQAAVAVDRDVAEVETAELLGEDQPRHDVGVVLHLGEQDGVAGLQVGPAPEWATRLSDSVVFLVKTISCGRVRRADEAARHQRGPARRARSASSAVA